MAVEKSYARLGAFIVVSVAVMLATTVFFVQRMQARDTIDAVTYTDGNVSGLDVSSPVRYRGVEIGRVSDVGIETRGSLVRINFDLYIDRLTSIGSDVKGIKKEAATGEFEGLRAQVVSNPVTGAAYLLIDMPQPPPPPMPLQFKPTRAYIPALPTLMSKIEDQVPALLDRATKMMNSFEQIVNEMPATIDRNTRFFADVENIIKSSDLPGLSADSRKFYLTTLAQMEQIAATMETALGPDGTLSKLADDTRSAIGASDLPATNKATRDAMNEATLAADELRRSLPAMRDAMMQMRDLARLLEEQPESVVYGPRQPKVKK